MPIEIQMPALSPTMTEGTLAKWTVKEGDEVNAGDVIAEIETDKATMEVEAVDEGILGKILVKEKTENVAVNKVIALILEDGETADSIKDYKPSEPEIVAENIAEGEDTDEDSSSESGASAGSGAGPILQAKATKAPNPPSVKKSGGAKVSPVAKRLAEENDILVDGIIGTGPNGRVIKSDVEDAISRGGVSGVVSRDESEFHLVENTGMRKTVAKRLLESKQQVPHFYLQVDCQLDNLLEARKQLNDKAAKKAGKAKDGKPNKPSYKLSVNDFVIKAVAAAMKDVPESNASWYDDAIVLYDNVDISVAVAIEGGLITPIVKNADQKTLPQISNEMKSLASKARTGTLMPEEYQGGGFSISNLGMFGIKSFSAIINPPQACILAVGAGEQKAVVKNGNLEIATVMNVTLSVDHRAVDGAVGATFLGAFKEYIENPATLLL